MLPYSEEQALVFIGIVFAIVFGVLLLLSIPACIGRWCMYKKAGLPGVAAIVPIWNSWVLCKMLYGNGAWMFLYLIPGVNLYFTFLLIFDMARAFGKKSLYGLLLLYFPYIFIPILGCSKNTEYVGPVDQQNDTYNGDTYDYGTTYEEEVSGQYE